MIYYVAETELILLSATLVWTKSGENKNDTNDISSQNSYYISYQITNIKVLTL